MIWQAGIMEVGPGPSRSDPCKEVSAVGLPKLFHKGEKTASPPAAADEAQPVCPHSVLIPHWDDPNDMGKPERVMEYTCDACGERFSRRQAERLRNAEAERIKSIIEK